MKLFVILALICSGVNAVKSLDELPKNIQERRLAGMQRRPKVVVVVVSDSRLETKRSDSGDIAMKLLAEKGFPKTELQFIGNHSVDTTLHKMLQDATIEVIIFIGGTGFSENDVTPEALEALSCTDMPGFGELFRWLSYQQWQHKRHEIGVMAMETRAKAVVSRQKIIFALPGSPDAVKIAMEELIIPSIPTLMHQIHKDDGVDQTKKENHDQAMRHEFYRTKHHMGYIKENMDHMENILSKTQLIESKSS